PDGGRAVSASEDRTLRVWDLSAGAGRVTSRALTGHKRAVTGVAVSADGRRALSASQDRTLKLWGLACGDEVRTLAGHQNWVTAVALSPDGRLALSSGDDLTLKLWDVERGREVDDIDLSASEDVARCVTFAPDGRSFLAGTADWVILR